MNLSMPAVRTAARFVSALLLAGGLCGAFVSEAQAQAFPRPNVSPGNAPPITISENGGEQDFRITLRFQPVIRRAVNVSVPSGSPVSVSPGSVQFVAGQPPGGGGGQSR